MSFKIVRSAGQSKYLTNAAFPAGIGTSSNVTTFGWMYAPTGAYSRLLALASGTPAAALDLYSRMYKESNNAVHNYVRPYGQAVKDAGNYPWSNNTWIAWLGTATLGGAATVQITGQSEDAQSTLHTSWNTAPEYINVGADYDNTADDSQTFYIAHVCVWKVALSGANRTSLIGGANPLAIDASNIVEYWSGASLTGYNGTVLSEAGSGGTITANDANNPTVDDPPGGASAEEALTGQAATSGIGTMVPNISVAL